MLCVPEVAKIVFESLSAKLLVDELFRVSDCDTKKDFVAVIVSLVLTVTVTDEDSLKLDGCEEERIP